MRKGFLVGVDVGLVQGAGIYGIVDYTAATSMKFDESMRYLITIANTC
jgi:hypothetical protein